MTEMAEDDKNVNEETEAVEPVETPDAPADEVVAEVVRDGCVVRAELVVGCDRAAGIAVA